MAGHLIALANDYFIEVIVQEDSDPGSCLHITVTDGIQTWTGISGSADRPKSLQIEPVEYLKTLKNVLTQSVKSNEYQVMITPRKKAVVLTIKLQQLRFFQKSLSTAASHDTLREFFQRIASRSRDIAQDNQQLKRDNNVLRAQLRESLDMVAQVQDTKDRAERVLCDKFIRVLNQKKRRIRQLMQQMGSQASTLAGDIANAEGDYDQDTDTDSDSAGPSVASATQPSPAPPAATPISASLAANDMLDAMGEEEEIKPSKRKRKTSSRRRSQTTARSKPDTPHRSPLKRKRKEREPKVVLEPDNWEDLI